MEKPVMRRSSYRHRASTETGMTMVAVLAAFTILMVVVLGSAASLSAATKSSRLEQDTDLALAAAQSALNDLLTRLRIDGGFLEDVAADHAAGDPAGYCAAPAAGGPAHLEADVFAAICEWSNSTPVGWAEDLGGRQYYHYAVTSFNASADQAQVIATGRAGQVVRSIQAYLMRETTPGWLYISNYELADPWDPVTYAPIGIDGYYGPMGDGGFGGMQLTSTACGGQGEDPPRPADLPGQPPALIPLSYHWELRDFPGSGTPEDRFREPRYYHDYQADVSRACQQPAFETWDTLNGKIHSNDTFTVNGARISGEFTTADPKCQSGQPQQCVIGLGANWADPVTVAHSNVRALPAPQDAKEIANSGTGCRYRGTTRIIFQGTKMRVWSKDMEASTGYDAAQCGSVDQLRSTEGAEVPIPTGNQGLIYVDSFTPTAGQKNTDGTLQIPAGWIDGTLPRGTYTATTPLGKNYVAETMMRTQDMERGLGNVFVEGKFEGRVTVAAARSIIITSDLVGVDNTKDVLGLSAGHAVEIYNPVLQKYEFTADPTQPGGERIPKIPAEGRRDQSWEPTDYYGGGETLRVEAAIYAAKASFRLQNWKTGPGALDGRGRLGKLEVYGSIAQNFRGVVAWRSLSGSLISGYEKSYAYNPALVDGQPLLFPPIQNSSWQVGWSNKVEPLEVVRSSRVP
ncbi:MAG: hypothetical protein LBO75_05400 [Bifidobacteriaceae bacterium]|jgi:Tfp pilus assembly protein PilX|nr:hypothetical protein [Bifidobacteriaceae bacterium]